MGQRKEKGASVNKTRKLGHCFQVKGVWTQREENLDWSWLCHKVCVNLRDPLDLCPFRMITKVPFTLSWFLSAPRWQFTRTLVRWLLYTSKVS